MTMEGPSGEKSDGKSANSKTRGGRVSMNARWSSFVHEFEYDALLYTYEIKVGMIVIIKKRYTTLRILRTHNN